MRVNKHIFALVLSFLVMISIFPALSAYAWGGAGATSTPTNTVGGSTGDYAYNTGYGFRVYLYDFDRRGEFWEGDSPYYLEPYTGESFADIFDKCASESAFYLGVPNNFMAYDEQYGDTPWVSINTMSASEFNTMPGMSGYTDPGSGFNSVDFAYYAEIFNQISEQANSIDGMQAILNWFAAHGVDTSGYNPEATLVVVEPVAMYCYGNLSWLITYQNARKYNGTQSGVFESFTYAVDMRWSCTVEGERFIPRSDADYITGFILAKMGGFYQSYLFEEGDCLTQAFDSTSGFSFYGGAKVDPSRIAANVAVVYDGAYGTTDTEKLYNYVGLNNKYPYKHWTGSGWEESSRTIDYLGIEEESQLNDYTIKLYDMCRLKVTSDMSFPDLKENLKVDDFELIWGMLVASGGDYNFGEAYSMLGLSYGDRSYDNLMPFWLEMRENTGFAVLSVVSVPRLANTLPPAVLSKNLLYRAFPYSTLGAHPVRGVTDGEIIGVSTEFLTKVPVVTSNVVSVNVITNDSEAVCDVETLEYGADVIKRVNTSETAKCIAIVPNYSEVAYSEEVISSISSSIRGISEEAVIAAFQAYFSEALVCEVVDGSKTVKLANDLYENFNYGYTIYELEITEVPPTITPTPTPEVTPEPDITPPVTPVSFNGTMDEVLEDYELNRVLPSVMDVIDIQARINPNLWTKDPDERNAVSCWLCSFDGYKYNVKSYDIVVYDKSVGMTVGRDNALSGTKLLLYNTSNGTFDRRSVLLGGWDVDTEGISGYVVDYAFNIVRSISGDKRTVSTLSRQSISESFGKNVLGLDYGNVPVSSTMASGYRNSFARVGGISDTLKFDAKYKVTGNKDKYETEDKTHSCSSWDDGYRYSNTERYHRLDRIPNELKAFNINGSSYATISEDVNIGVNKYSTKVMTFGKNDVDTGIVSLEPAPYTADRKKILYPYTIAAVQNHDLILKFYPEVEMKAYEYSGDTISGMNDVTESTVLTMGEEQRLAQSSSLYIYSVRTAPGGVSDMTGMAYSDAALAGSWFTRTGLPIIPGGADINVVGDPNFKVRLSGYSLDVINKSVDGDGLKISQRTTIPYNNIIADNSEIYLRWGNSATDELYENFEDWVEQMADVRNYQADLKMVIKGNGYATKSAQAFNVAIGYISGGECSKEEVFPLSIKNGVLDTSTESYDALIESIASDYNCEYDKAVEVFESSGLYTAIVNAIESSASPINNSQSGPVELGTAAHWYDEQVKTLVIRRFSATPLQFHDVIAADKLDYGMVSNKGKTATGQFYFTLYFERELEPFLGYAIYDPSTPVVRERALETGNIIIDNLYIDGAAFSIESVTTSDF